MTGLLKSKFELSSSINEPLTGRKFEYNLFQFYVATKENYADFSCHDERLFCLQSLIHENAAFVVFRFYMNLHEFFLLGGQACKAEVLVVVHQAVIRKRVNAK